MSEEYKTVGIEVVVIELDGDPFCRVAMNFEDGYSSNWKEITMPSFVFKFKCEYWELEFAEVLSQFPPHRPLKLREQKKELKSCVGCSMKCYFKNKYHGKVIVIKRAKLRN